jgi:hypothetical protein
MSMAFKSWVMEEENGSNFLKNHTKFFMGYWGYKTPDDVDCIMCGNFATDIHHIKGRGAGGDKHHYKDNEFNLAPLCRDCHNKTSNKEFNAKVLVNLLVRIIDKVKTDGRI